MYDTTLDPCSPDFDPRSWGEEEALALEIAEPEVTVAEAATYAIDWHAARARNPQRTARLAVRHARTRMTVRSTRTANA